MWEFLKSLLDSSRERIKNPVLGTYTIAFVIWNWRAILILCFSKFSIEDRIMYIDSWLCNKWCLVGPLLITGFVIICVPFILAYLDKILSPPRLDRITIKHSIEKSEKEHDLEMAAYDYRIQDQKAGTKTIADFEQKLSDLSKENQNLSEMNLSNQQKNAADVNRLNAELVAANNRINELLQSSGEHADTFWEPFNNRKKRFLSEKRLRERFMDLFTVHRLVYDSKDNVLTQFADNDLFKFNQDGNGGYFNLRAGHLYITLYNDQYNTFLSDYSNYFSYFATSDIQLFTKSTLYSKSQLTTKATEVLIDTQMVTIVNDNSLQLTEKGRRFRTIAQMTLSNKFQPIVYEMLKLIKDKAA